MKKQLLAWGKFHAGGKELRLMIIFNYIEDDHSIRVATKSNEKRGRKKHYQLQTHHLKRLIAYIKGSGILKCQDDVPNAIREELFLKEQQKLENQQSKSNKILASGNYPPININFIEGQPHLQSSAAYSITASNTSPTQNGQIVDQLIIDGLRDIAAYNATLANGLDLKQIHEDHDPRFFIEKGVAVRIAHRFVSDIVK
ncbi:unnamed protein product [Penicillium salamii]|nr:unnamed protein product [Penicillium salamii]CAG8264841.1 unnamed protein product [Penicillium salamii]